MTKSKINSIRGIKSDRIIDGLINKGLVSEAGRSDGIGRPILYATTETFLKQFGFESIKELPQIDDIGSALTADEYDVDEMQISIEEMAIKKDDSREQ